MKIEKLCVTELPFTRFNFGLEIIYTPINIIYVFLEEIDKNGNTGGTRKCFFVVFEAYCLAL